MENLFQDVARVKSKVRLALTGPTNAGKTYTALLIAYGITKDWSKIALIDSERGRARFYANRTDLPFPTGTFKYAPMEPPYSPEKYIEYIKAAEQLVGEDGVIIVDSFTHPWYYEGGVLDIKEDMSKQSGKNSYTAWHDAGKIQNQLINTALSVKCHNIVTMRSKMNYVLETNEQGKTQPKKVGLAPMQRDDVEYEFDITLMLDNDHSATIIKDTTFLGGKGTTLPPITPELGEQLVKWLDEGIDPAVFKEEQRQNHIKQIQAFAKANPSLIAMYKAMYSKETKDLTLEEAKDVLNKFREVSK